MWCGMAPSTGGFRTPDGPGESRRDYGLSLEQIDLVLKLSTPPKVHVALMIEMLERREDVFDANLELRHSA